MSQAFPTHAGQLLAIVASCGAEGRELVLDSEDCMAIAGHVRRLTISTAELSERDEELKRTTADCQANLEAARKAEAELESEKAAHLETRKALVKGLENHLDGVGFTVGFRGNMLLRLTEARESVAKEVQS